jgi:hypothetical protein
MLPLNALLPRAPATAARARFGRPEAHLPRARLRIGCDVELDMKPS